MSGVDTRTGMLPATPGRIPTTAVPSLTESCRKAIYNTYVSEIHLVLATFPQYPMSRVPKPPMPIIPARCISITPEIMINWLHPSELLSNGLAIRRARRTSHTSLRSYPRRSEVMVRCENCISESVVKIPPM